MFGYVMPDKENLLVKELSFYKATYCGLCSVIKKEISFILPLTLSYDFVFMTMLRAILTSEGNKLIEGHCKYNPLKKTSFVISEKSTSFTAKASLILTYLKLEDDFQDGDLSFFKQFYLFPLKRHLKGKVKKLILKNSEYSSLFESVKSSLDEISTLEKEGCENIDVFCEVFGKLLSTIASFELDGKNELIAKEVGDAVGRYIYLLDAIDDAPKDEKSGAFNPLIKKYGSVKGVKDHSNELDVAVGMFAKRALSALNLTEKHEYTPILENILTRGFGKEAYKIMTKNGDKND